VLQQLNLRKLPLCGATEDADCVESYFEWPTLEDLTSMQSVQTHNEPLKLTKVEYTTYAVLWSIRVTMSDGSQSPIFGTYKNLNSVWHVPDSESIS